MKFTVVADDKAVYIDGNAETLDDVSILPPDVHAVQWDGRQGEIEYRTLTCETCGGHSKKPNKPITDISPYQSLIVAHGKRKAEREAQDVALKKGGAPNAS